MDQWEWGKWGSGRAYWEGSHSIYKIKIV
jgi:hypothetical protein